MKNWQNIFFFFLVTSFVDVLCSTHGPLPSHAEYDEPCGRFFNSVHCNATKNLICINGTCRCSPILAPAQNYEAKMYCNFLIPSNIGAHGIQSNCDLCPAERICNEVSYLNTCYSVVFQNPSDFCGFDSNMAFLCNYERFSFCQDSVCTCFREDFYNSSSKACESNPPSQHIITRRGVHESTHGKHCTADSDCIHGLICDVLNLTCSCPSFCPYKSEEGICDCGKVNLQTPPQVICIGIILGLVSVAFWYKLIKITCEKRSRNQPMREEQENAPDGPEAYPGIHQVPLEALNRDFIEMPSIHLSGSKGTTPPPPYSEVASSLPSYPLSPIPGLCPSLTSHPTDSPPPYEGPLGCTGTTPWSPNRSLTYTSNLQTPTDLNRPPTSSIPYHLNPSSSSAPYSHSSPPESTPYPLSPPPASTPYPLSPPPESTPYPLSPPLVSHPYSFNSPPTSATYSFSSSQGTTPYPLHDTSTPPASSSPCLYSLSQTSFPYPLPLTQAAAASTTLALSSFTAPSAPPLPTEISENREM